MKLSHTYRYIIALILILFSCQKNELAPTEAITDAITFSVSSTGGYTATTRAAGESLVLISDDGEDSLVLLLTDIPETSDTISTKGTPVDDNNIIEQCGEQIALRAFFKDEQFINDVLVFDDNGYARTKIASYWPQEENALVDFWSFHPQNIAQHQSFKTNNNISSPSLSFYYNLRKGNENILVDATEQKDLFLAYTRQGKENGSVDLEYTHALSAIRFTAGKALAGRIENISISNVYAGGTVTYKPNETTKINWVLDNKPLNLSQDFTRKINENFIGDLSQIITIDNTVFMLIPQPLTDKQLTITYLREGETVARVYTVNLPDGKWEAGKSYTYTLTLMDGLGISIETPSPPTSNNVIDGIRIKNTYNKPCYIRAMIIANWVDAEGNVAAIFNPDEINLKISQGNSNYQLIADWGNHWFYDSDTDIYYYKKRLNNTASTVNLFNKFTNPIQHSEGLKLDFTVLVQAVEAENSKVSVKGAWGETIAAMLE